MIKPEQVPIKAWLAAKSCIGDHVENDAFKEAVAAALSAWPGMATIKEDDRVTVAAVYLPLTPQEASDD